MLIQNIINAYSIYLICIGTAITLIALYNVMLRYFAQLLAWLMLSLFAVGIAGIGYLLRIYAKTVKQNSDEKFTYDLLIFLVYFIWACAIIYFLIILCMWHRIMISV